MLILIDDSYTMHESNQNEISTHERIHKQGSNVGTLWMKVMWAFILIKMRILHNKDYVNRDHILIHL